MLYNRSIVSSASAWYFSVDRGVGSVVLRRTGEVCRAFAGSRCRIEGGLRREREVSMIAEGMEVVVMCRVLRRRHAVAGRQRLRRGERTGGGGRRGAIVEWLVRRCVC